ncbi:MAG: tyrosine--tRNA ligase [Phycisphaerales bacterium]
MPGSTPPIDFLAEIKWRGLLHQCTDEPGLRAHLANPAAEPRHAYAGFDPTADSLTIGNLVPIMLLVHFQRAGHVPVVVMGGGTGLIGDPSGKSAERQLFSEQQVRDHVEAQRPIFERIFTNAAAASASSTPARGTGVPPVPIKPPTPVILNNLDWLGKLGYLEVLRDVGKHFSVNMMIQKDSVRERLHARDQGISYTEFSYMVLQGYDFMQLRRSSRVTLQVGGSDQWGNIVEGIRLIRSRLSHGMVPPGRSLDEHLRLINEEATAFGLTAPLVTKSDGGKFGKSESGAVWLTPERTSPYAFYQFWLNAADADAGRFLRMFTLLDRPTIEALEARHAQNPAAREAQRVLAREATTLVHGKTETEKAEAAAKALFGGGTSGGGSGGGAAFEALIEAMADVPSRAIERSSLDAEGTPILDAIAFAPIAASKREAREHLQTGAISVNGERVGSDYRLTTKDLLKGGVIAIRRGKKTWLLLRAG